MKKKKLQPGVQGEGDYISGRKFQEEQRSFVERGLVEQGHAADERELAHHDRRLDAALEDTFPASDPVSISPGAN
jgi:hypothetical protein